MLGPRTGVERQECVSLSQVDILSSLLNFEPLENKIHV